ncbi:GNAT family N-acetyltransferase [Bermanella marisrubri]|nr:GNAT family N-acetyltransferase [Bermanella marisrubri]
MLTTELGDIELKPFDLEKNIDTLFGWTSQAYAKFWGHLDSSIEVLKADYEQLIGSGHTQCYLGYVNQNVQFFLEIYDPKHDDIGKHYDACLGDIGLHILIAPADRPIHGFTQHIFSVCMDFLFSHEEVKRVVVEPDVNNEKIHRINQRAGFIHERIVDLGHKQAFLGFCTKTDFERARLISNMPLNHKANELSAFDAVESLDKTSWHTVNRQHIQKAISELAHERLINPKRIHDKGDNHYVLVSDLGDIEYRFCATVMNLNHWLIDQNSIEKWMDGSLQDLDAIQFVVEFQQSMGIAESMLPTYLEEISSSLCGRAYKLKHKAIPCEALLEADFQLIETSMNEGHPSFIANNGRIGFDAIDFRRYAPEAANPVKLIWIAANQSNADFASISELDYETLLETEFDAATLQKFDRLLSQQGKSLSDTILIPVHPWQWFNKLSHIYAADIARGDIICLGYSDDAYQAQQSIRTFYNVSHPHKHYVKTALSIVNMGFVRGLSSYYMRTTPAINEWLHETLSKDPYIQKTGFTILRELAAVGYRNPHFEQANVGQSPYKKMLAGLWRESPSAMITPQQQLATMASLLHIDHNGDAYLLALIKASGLNIDDWLSQYFKAYLTPILHCFYAHEIVFMPHGENIILTLENHVPVHAFMKDIGEEVCLLNSDKNVPDDVARIHVSMPESMELLSVFTDIFDGFFRYLSAILLEKANYSEHTFWRKVSDCIHDYQSSQPQLSQRFAQHDIFQKTFSHSCLNRLQLRNNQQMVDLSDPANSLAFAGTLDNPVAPFVKDQRTESNQSDMVMSN